MHCFRSHRTLYSIGTVAAIAVLAVGCNKSALAPTAANASLSDPEVGQKIFGQMAEGDLTVQGDIDWEGFKASGLDIGSQYMGLKDEANKSAFRTSFLQNYSKSFKGTGASASMLTGWTAESSDANQAVVTAKTNRGTGVRLTLVKKNGGRLLSGLDLIH
jgi:hypothetical protein